MKKLVVYAMLLLGVVELFYGIFWGPMRMFPYEMPFYRAVLQPAVTVEKAHAFFRYVHIFEYQWHFVAVFGLATIGLAFLLDSCDTRSNLKVS